MLPNNYKYRILKSAIKSEEQAYRYRSCKRNYKIGLEYDSGRFVSYVTKQL